MLGHDLHSYCSHQTKSVFIGMWPIRTSTRDVGTHCIGEQQMLSRACSYAQSRQSLRFSQSTKYGKK